MPVEDVFNGPPLVGRGIFQQDNDGTAEMPKQLSEKDTDFIVADVVEEQKNSTDPAADVGGSPRFRK